MKILEIIPKELDHRQFIRRSALESDCSMLITEETLITTNGKPVIYYGPLRENLDDLRRACLGIKYQETRRSTGLVTRSAIFGFNPANPIRKQFCSKVAMSVNQPEFHKIVCDFGQVLLPYYQEYFPDVFHRHEALTREKVLDEWKIKDTPFTSGIVNKNNPLKYHFDGGNFKEVLSNMVAFKHQIGGGHLAIPAYDITLEIADGTVTIFDGQDILHGVTPIQMLKEDSYRYTIVYYSLEKMWECKPLTEELLAARKRRMDIERNRMNRLGKK